MVNHNHLNIFEYSNFLNTRLICLTFLFKEKIRILYKLVNKSYKKNNKKSSKTNSLSKRLSYCLNEKNRLSQLLRDNSSFQHFVDDDADNNNDENYEKKSINKVVKDSFVKSNSYSYSTTNKQKEDLSRNQKCKIYDDQKRFIQITTEIYEIAQVFPSILSNLSIY